MTVFQRAFPRTRSRVGQRGGVRGVGVGPDPLLPPRRAELLLVAGRAVLAHQLRGDRLAVAAGAARAPRGTRRAPSTSSPRAPSSRRRGGGGTESPRPRGRRRARRRRPRSAGFRVGPVEDRVDAGTARAGSSRPAGAGRRTRSRRASRAGSPRPTLRLAYRSAGSRSASSARLARSRPVHDEVDVGLGDQEAHARPGPVRGAPDDPTALARQPLHRGCEQVGVAAVHAVGADHDHSPARHAAAARRADELVERGTDAGAAVPVDHQLGGLGERAVRVAAPQRRA